MSKRLYVAVGSVGVKCLMELIRRYQDEGFYKDTNDMFLGMDTASEMIARLRRLDKDNRHIDGVHIVHEDQASPVRDVVGSFRKKWDKSALIPMTGVGGDRKLSFSTLKWTQHVELKKRIATLTKEDELILIGTAFGGTSTGLFWNVATWMRANLPRDENKHCAEFYSFVVLPGDQGGDLEKYPWSYNLCAFMQDLQTVEVTQRIQRMLSNDVPFRSPVFALYNPAVSRQLLPTWSEGNCGASDHGFLPFDKTLIVPTPDAGAVSETQVPDIVAEQAFVLGALNGWKSFRVTDQTIDLMKTVHGLDYRKTEEAFGGFNMIAGRSARRVALSAVFWKKYAEQAKQFLSAGAKVAEQTVISDIHRAAETYIKSDQQVLALIEAHRARFETALDNRSLSAAEVSALLASVCKDLRDTLQTQPYAWMGLSEFVQRCREWSRPVIALSPDVFVTLNDLQDVYVQIRDGILAQARNIDQVRVRILELPTKCRQLTTVRCKKVATRALGAADIVESEIRAEYRRAELEYFDWFIECCRCDATKAQIVDDAGIAIEREKLVKNYESRMKSVFDGTLRNTLNSALPACIYLDKSAPSDLSSLLKTTRGRYLQLILAGMFLDETTVRNEAEDEERRTVAELGEQAAALGPANPLSNILLDFSKGEACRAFSDVFKVEDSNKYHCHFIIQHGSVAPYTWGKVKQFSTCFETFSHLLPANAALSDGQNVSPADLKGDSYFYDAVHAGESQGAWIGTLKLDSSIESVISAVYDKPAKKMNVWQQRAYSAVADGAPQRSFLSLAETLALGVLLGCIDEAVCNREDLGALGVALQVDKAALKLAVPPSEVELYFKHVNDSGRKYRLDNIHTDWIRPLMTWVESSFWKDTDMESFQRTLLDVERSILGKISLRLGEDELRKPLMQLSAKVKDLLHVTVG